MAFIGNNVQTQGFTPAIDYFSGNGVTVTFTLSRPLVSVAQVIAVIENVPQNPSTAFSVSGNSITFTSAPPSGTNNIWVEYTSLITQYNAISQDPSVIGDITATGGFLAVGDFGNTYTDGTIVDYVTGNARITTGPADGMTFYNGGTSARNALMTIDSSGNVGIGTSSPTGILDARGNVYLGSSSAANTTYIRGTANWNYAGLNVIRNASNTSTPKFIGMPLDGDDLSSTTIGGYNSIWGAYDSSPTTGSTSAALNGAMIYGAYAGHRWYNNGTERMRINSSGYVTIPNQVSFNAYTTTQMNNAGQVVPFNNTNYNIGSAFSTSTNRFTAPIAGRYLITAGVAYASAGYYDIVIRKNGVDLNNAQFGQNGGGTGFPQSSCTQVIQLAANDYLEMYMSGANGGVSRTNYTWFTGELLG